MGVAPLKARAVFLDRDGVLNEPIIRDGRSYPPADAGSLVICEGAPEALKKLKEAGFLCICVTNQPDVARGSRTLAAVEDMNRKVRDALPLDDLYMCPHDRADDCACRKPRPGMLLEAALKWRIDLAASWLVGDRKSDVEAGRAAGCRCVFIDRAYLEEGPGPAAQAACANIAQASEIIVAADAASQRGWSL